MKINVKCTKATYSDKQDSTCLKLVTSSHDVTDEFGTTAGSTTYYRFVTGDATSKLNVSAEMDLSNFDIVTNEREFADKTTGEIITRKLKYLYAKRS